MNDSTTAVPTLVDALRQAAADFEEISECLDGLEGDEPDNFIAQAAQRARNGRELAEQAANFPAQLPKTYREAANIGRAKYVVSFHDGVKRHRDGSPFFDMEIFRNQKAKNAFVAALVRVGYSEDGR